MTGKDLFREVGNISEKYITEAEETKKSIIHNVAFRRGIGTAACLVLCVGIFAITRTGGKRADTTAADSTPHYDSVANEPESMADGTNNVQMNTAEQEAIEDAGNSSDWEDFLDSIRDNEKSESAVEAEDYATSNTPEEVVGEEPAISVPEIIGFDKESVIERLQLYPNTYDELLQTDAFVVMHSKVKGGLSMWESFLEDSQNNISSSVDLLEFTVEGDAIITAVVYDGETYHVVMDCTRDAWGKTGIVEYEYKYLYTDTQDGWTTVILSDLKLEGEDVRKAIMEDGMDVHHLVEYMEE